MDDKKTYTTVDDLLKEADQEYLRLLNENKLTEVLQAIGTFPTLSVVNSVLIKKQMPSATKVMAFDYWGQCGRKIIKDQKSLKKIGTTRNAKYQDYVVELETSHDKENKNREITIEHVFDISQTEGDPLKYENTNKETLAKYFDNVKKNLETLVKGYEVEYSKDITENSKVDKENKKIIIKDGMQISDVFNELVDRCVELLIDTKFQEGLTAETKPNIKDIEIKCAKYALRYKYDLDIPNYDFSEIAKYTENEKLIFRDNLQKSRAVVSQVANKLETAVEYAIRDLDRKMKNIEQELSSQENQATQQPHKQTQYEGEQL